MRLEGELIDDDGERVKVTAEVVMMTREVVRVPPGGGVIQYRLGEVGKYESFNMEINGCMIEVVE